jgi:hypothetical protein
MTEPELSQDPADPLAELRARAESLERELAASHAETDARVIRAELKAEAIRAGMVDLDGLKLLDLAIVKLAPTGEVDGAGALMARMKRDKPWLFGGVSSSSASTPPPAQAPRKKLAKDMTDAEYRAARADLIKRR